MHYLFRVICFEYRAVTVEYFMDIMQYNEVVDIIKNIKWLDRNERELDRYKVFVNVQANSKKKLKPEDILKLPWDDENKNTGTQISEDLARQYRDRAKELEMKIQNMTFENVDMNDMYKNIKTTNG